MLNNIIYAQVWSLSTAGYELEREREIDLLHNPYIFFPLGFSLFYTDGFNYIRDQMFSLLLIKKQSAV